MQRDSKECRDIIQNQSPIGTYAEIWRLDWGRRQVSFGTRGGGLLLAVTTLGRALLHMYVQ